jgi:hypothetical protein
MSGHSFKQFAILGFVVLAASASAEHQWGNYHWESASTPFDLTVINSTTDDWDPYVSIALDDWSLSTVLNMVEDPEGSTSSRVRRQCKGPNGKVRICNLAYGFNGWLGIAGISVDTNGHIISGYTKLNDSYFNNAPYNDAAWKQSVTCQELLPARVATNLMSRRVIVTSAGVHHWADAGIPRRLFVSIQTAPDTSRTCCGSVTKVESTSTRTLSSWYYDILAKIRRPPGSPEARPKQPLGQLPEIKRNPP